MHRFLGILDTKVALGNNMLFTYVVSFFVLLIPILILDKLLFHLNDKAILILTIFIVGYSIMLGMDKFLKQLKIIIKNAYSKK